MKQNMMKVDQKEKSSFFRPYLVFCAIIFSYFAVIGVTKAGNLEEGIDLYQKGEYAKAFALIKKSAESKEAEGEAVLAYFYANGIGTKTNEKKSAEWYQKSANQGFAEAQYQLGKIYEEGIGLKQDDREALKWYKLAAKQKHVKAQLALGLMYMEGKGIDQTSTFSSTILACEVFQNGDAELKKNRIAQYYIGQCFEEGKSMPKDEASKIALDWYKSSAKQEYVPAMVAIGSMYFAGRGVKQDYAEGVKWYQKAAEKGDAKAQAALGLAYEKGLGVLVDQQVAIKWYTMAAEQGQVDAKIILDDLLGRKDNKMK